MSVIIQVVSLGLLQMVAILIGGLILGLTKKYDSKKETAVLSFAAGVMIGIAFLDLILEANEMVSETGDLKWFIGAGFIIGLLFILFLDFVVPHEPTRGTQARTPLRSLYKKPKLIKRLMSKNDVRDTVSRNIITELRYLAQPFHRTYIEIFGHKRIALPELAKNLNLDINELNEHISYLQRHNYIKEIIEEGKTYYSVSLEDNGIKKRGVEELRKIGWRTVLGFSLHDFPEGITIGVGFGANPFLGVIVAISLFLHNITEGISIAASFKSSGTKTKDLLKINSIPGFLVPFGALIGIIISLHIPSIYLAFILSFSAGMFVFIATNDLLPEAIKLGEETIMTISMIFGFCIACLLFMM